MFRTAGIGAGLLSPLVVASEFASLAPALSCSDHSSTATSLVWMLSRQSCLIAATRSFTGTTSLIFLGCRIRFLRFPLIDQYSVQIGVAPSLGENFVELACEMEIYYVRRNRRAEISGTRSLFFSSHNSMDRMNLMGPLAGISLGLLAT